MSSQHDSKVLETTVLISSGVGRLHFIEIAKLLEDQGRHFELICGFIPDPKFNKFLFWIGPLLGRPNLPKRLSMRLGDCDSLLPYLRSNALAEGVTQLLLRLADLHLVPRGRTQTWAWRFFGWRSRRYMRDQTVFHVRSGAGQGGAISTARRLGMRIIVDQSIAHPAYIARWLVPEYEKVGADFEGRPENPFWSLVLEDCRDADLLVVNSEFVKRTFVAEGFDPARIRVLYWGVREDFIGLKTDYNIKGRVKLLFTGNLELRKGLRILVEALEALRDQMFDFELHVAGSDLEARRFYGDRLSRLPVIWHGSLVQDDLKRLLAESDIYVFPTFAEGCARSAMEALFAGLPVVTTEACGLPGEPGLQFCEVPVGDSLALASAVQAISANFSVRSSLGLEAKYFASNGKYSWSKFGDELYDIYRECWK